MRNPWVVLDVETSIVQGERVSGPGGRANPYGSSRCVYLGLQRCDHDPVVVFTSDFGRELRIEMDNAREARPDAGALVLIGHNVSFDIHHCLKYEDLALLPGDLTIWDTMTAEYYLEGQRPEARMAKLDTLFDKYGWEHEKDTEVTDLFKQGIGADQIPRGQLLPYLENDVLGTQHVAVRQMARARDLGMLRFLRDQMDAQLLFTAMEQVGLPVSEQATEELISEKSGEYARCQRELTELVERRLPERDPALQVLGDRLLKAAICGGTYRQKFRQKVGAYKNGNDKYQVVKKDTTVSSVDGFVGTPPEKFDGVGPESSVHQAMRASSGEAARYLQMVVDFRALKKEVDTYIDGYLRRVDKHGVMRCSYNQTITPSGRVSSSNTNLQNLPN